MSNAELIAAAQSLETEVKKLADTVEKQTEAIDRIDTKTQKSSTRIRIIVAVLALIVSVVGFNAYLVREVRSTQQQTTRVLCPLYGIFLASDTPEASQTLSPEQQEFRKEAFQVIRDGMVDLGCS